MSEILRIFIGLFVIYLAFVLGLYLFQRHFIYHPGEAEKADKSKAPWMETITVHTHDGLALEAWYQAPAAGGKPVIVYFHGNGDGIDARVPKAQHFMDAGYGVLLAEYRGYSSNPGQPNEQGLYHDGRAYMDWMVKIMDIPAAQIILYGESLGSGVAVQMGTEYGVKAVILDAPFDSLLSVAQSRYFYVPFIPLLLKDHFRNDTKIAAINAPVLIGLAGKDNVVPNPFGRALYQAAIQPKILKIYEESDHNHLYQYGFSDDALMFIEGL